MGKNYATWYPVDCKICGDAQDLLHKDKHFVCEDCMDKKRTEDQKELEAQE